MRKTTVLFSALKVTLPRIRIIFKYFAVMALIFISTGIIVRFLEKRISTVNGTIVRRQSASSRESQRTTSTLKVATQTRLSVVNPVVNPHPFRYILNPETFCSKKDIFIITYVHSAPRNFKKRDAIRQTWGKRKYYLKKRVDVVFILGQVANTGVMTSVRKESDLHGDIVQEDFVDSYRNLTYKAIAGLKWVSTSCRQAVYVLKTDDDIFVNFYVFIRHILPTVEFRYGRTRLILCHVWVNMPVIRDHKSKWYVSKEDFAPYHYPPYCSGSAYLMSSDVTDGLYRTSLTTPFFWVDDYYITGLLIHKLNITLRRYNSRYIFYPSRFKKQLHNKYYDSAVFILDRFQRMLFLWNTVIARENARRYREHFKH